MSAVRIVTDSGCDLSQEYTDARGIRVVPLSIRFGDDELTDRVELTPTDFYDRMAQSDDLPETAAPAPGAFEMTFRELAAEGATDVICINMSSDLSATGQSARTAASTLGDVVNVHCVDSRSVSVGMGTLVTRAAEAASNGDDAENVLALVNDLIPRVRVIAVLDTLDNLKKGGRIGGAQAMLGSMLSIKPCIDVSTGKVEEAGKQRTRKKALGWLRETLTNAGDIENLVVGHGLADDFDDFMASLDDIVDTSDARTAVIGPVIGTHGGPRVVGVSWTVPGRG